MDRVVIPEKLKNFIQKYKYAVLVFLIGLVFLILPAKKESMGQEISNAESPAVQKVTASQELAQILSGVQGAGKVQVMLTVRSGEETVYQTNDQITKDAERTTSNIVTVIVADSQRTQNGLVRQVNPPEYLGAIILCEGADRASVRLDIIDAVSKITGLGANQISVLKMK